MPSITLPVPGETPGPSWAELLNAAILAINAELVSGRLSPSGLQQSIAEAAAELNPEALSDGFIAQQISTPGSQTSTEVTEVADNRVILKGTLLDLRQFGAVADNTTDLALAINAAVSAIKANPAPTTLVLPAPPLGGSYYLSTNAVIDVPEVSLVGFGSRIRVANNAAIIFGDNPVASAPGRNYFSEISGLNLYRAGTSGGASIPADSSFIELRAVRRFQINSNVFTGADAAVRVRSADYSIMSSGGSHVIGMISFKNNEVSEVEHFFLGENNSANTWTTLSDFSFDGNTVNRFYTTCYSFQGGVDGVTFGLHEKVFSLDFLSSNPRRPDLRHVLHIAKGSDWVSVNGSHWFGSGREGIRIEQGRTLVINGLVMPRTGILEPKDAIYFEGQTGYFAEVTIVGSNLKWFTKSAVKIVGDMEKVTLGVNATDYSTAPSSYVGTIALSTVTHYRYDVSGVTGLKSTQIQISDSTTGNSGEVDSLPGKTYTMSAKLLAPFQAQSSASRTGNFGGLGTLFNLTDTLDATSEYGGTILLTVKAGNNYSSTQKVSSYLLGVTKAETGAITPIWQSGYLTGATTTDPSFTFSRSGNTLQCTPVGSASGQNFTFTAQSTGNLVVG